MSAMFQMLMSLADLVPATYLTLVDALAPENEMKHYRLNEASETFADRKGNGGVGTAVGTVTRTNVPLVQDDAGGGGIGLKGTGWIEVADIVDIAASPTFTMIATVVFDGVPTAKAIIASSPDSGVGSWSWEVETNGSVRVWRRHSGGVYIWNSPAVVPFDGTPVQLGYSNSDEDQRFRVWIAGTKYSPDAGGVDPAYPGGPWTLPPAGNCMIGAYSTSSFPTAVAPFRGMISEFIYINHAISTSLVENLSAEVLANAVYLDTAATIDLGTVELDAPTLKTVPSAKVHPEVGFSGSVVTQPLLHPAVSGAALGWTVTGASGAAGPETFTGRVVAGAAQSAVAMWQIETVEEVGGTPDPPLPDLTHSLYGRASGSLAPVPNTGDPVYGRADNSLTPTPDTGDRVYPRKPQ